MLPCQVKKVKHEWLHFEGERRMMFLQLDYEMCNNIDFTVLLILDSSQSGSFQH
jgi:hypothetical protein